MASVQRYTKTHWLVRHRARLEADALAAGEAFWRDPAGCLLAALPNPAAEEHFFLKTMRTVCKKAAKKTYHGIHRLLKAKHAPTDDFVATDNEEE